MKSTGIVRHLDELGRIVIPMELRRTLGINAKDPMSISVEGERIILTKHEDSCVICGTTESSIPHYNERPVCVSCIRGIKGL